MSDDSRSYARVTFPGYDHPTTTAFVHLTASQAALRADESHGCGSR